jgi:hypothetical protein
MPAVQADIELERLVQTQEVRDSSPCAQHPVADSISKLG